MAKLNKQNWDTGFEQVPNELIERASFRATGLWAFLAKLPDGWDFSVRGIATLRSEGLDVIRSAVKELEGLGYLKREQVRGEGGRMGGGNWVISRSPLHDLPTTEKPTTAEPTSENTTQQHTTKKTDSKKTDSTKKLPDDCYALAEFLKESIIERYPNNKIAVSYRDNWAKEIDLMVRIDGRDYNSIKACIYWAFNVSDFWHRQIWSGGNLRKHYDRMSSQVQADAPKIVAQRKQDLQRALANGQVSVQEFNEIMAKLGN